MRNKPFKGRVKIDDYSSLRKLKRAMRRGTVPAERQLVIHFAMEKAAKRRSKYLSAHKRAMQAMFPYRVTVS